MTTIPPLAFDIRARDRSDHAFNSAQRNVKKLNRDVRSLNSDIRASAGFMRGFGKSAIGAAAAFLSVGAAISKMTSALERFDALAKTARQSGLDAEYYQTLAFMAGEASVNIGVLDNALRKFTISVGEARNGSGALYTELKRADKALLDQILSADTAEERIRLYADAVANAEDAEQKASLTKAAFGQRGADLVRVLELGSAAMDESAAKAAGLGNIIESKILDQAEEMQNRLGNAADALDKQLSAALVEASPLMINFYEDMAIVVKTTREWTAALGEIPAQLAAIGNSQAFQDLSAWLDSMGLIDWDAVRQIEDRMNGGADSGGGFTTGSTFGGPNDRIADAFSVLPDPVQIERTASSLDELLGIFKAETKALSDLNSEVEKTEKAFEKASGAPLDLTKNLKTATDQGEDLSNVLSSAASGLVSDFARGAEALDALKNAGVRVAQQFIEMQVQAALFNKVAGAGGAGGGANIFGSLFKSFAGFFADGGTLGAGQWGIAGEDGPEPVIGPAQVVPSDTVANMVAGGRGSANDNGTSRIVVQLSGELEAMVAEIARGQAVQVVEEYTPALTARAVGEVGMQNSVNTSPAFRRG